jgi:hypothetical protein
MSDLSSLSPAKTPASGAVDPLPVSASLNPAVVNTPAALQGLQAALADLDQAALQAAFKAQGKFVGHDAVLPPDVTQGLIDATDAARVEMNRNYLPRHKKGGSVSRHSIDRLAPFIADLYNSPAFIGLLETIAGEPLQASPADDPHAYALYFYTEPGDHIGWHYDTSYYKGRRYTVLLGIENRSSAVLEYRLHTREAGRKPVDGAVALKPGGMVFFDGDQLLHRITPLGVDEERISLTFEYVTDTRMGRWQRFISSMKDAVAYFGFRQVFSGTRGANNAARAAPRSPAGSGRSGG